MPRICANLRAGHAEPPTPPRNSGGSQVRRQNTVADQGGEGAIVGTSAINMRRKAFAIGASTPLMWKTIFSSDLAVISSLKVSLNTSTALASWLWQLPRAQYEQQRLERAAAMSAALSLFTFLFALGKEKAAGCLNCPRRPGHGR